MPGTYCGAVMPVDSSLNPLAEGDICKKYKPYLCKYPFLHGAITISAGCTIVFNRKLKQIISQYHPKSFIMHDSWIQQVCLAIGGFVIKDSSPYIKYRQHENNVVGARKLNLFETILEKKERFIKKTYKGARSYISKEIISFFGEYLNEYERKKIENIAKCNSLEGAINLCKDKDIYSYFSEKKVVLFTKAITGWI